MACSVQSSWLIAIILSLIVPCLICSLCAGNQGSDAVGLLIGIMGCSQFICATSIVASAVMLAMCDNKEPGLILAIPIIVLVIIYLIFKVYANNVRRKPTKPNVSGTRMTTNTGAS